MKRYPLGSYGLGIVLATLFLVAWLGQLWTQWQEFVAEQASHGETAHYGDFAWVFWSRTFENWQSEFLQVLAFVILTSFLIHRGSAESKDGDEEMQASLRRIEARLESMEANGPADTAIGIGRANQTRKPGGTRPASLLRSGLPFAANPRER